MLKKKEEKLLEAIKSHFREYGEYPSFATLMLKLKYKSKRSISLLIDSLVHKDVLSRTSKGGYKLLQFEDFNHEETRQIPLLGFVSCGLPAFAEENIETHFSISRNFLKSSSKYFFLRADGDSMNKSNSRFSAINDNDLILVEVTQDISEGDWVVALINNEATIKEISFREDHVILKPSSTNPKHKPIILESDLTIQGVVSRVFNGFDLY